MFNIKAIEKYLAPVIKEKSIFFAMGNLAYYVRPQIIDKWLKFEELSVSVRTKNLMKKYGAINVSEFKPEYIMHERVHELIDTDIISKKQKKEIFGLSKRFFRNRGLPPILAKEIIFTKDIKKIKKIRDEIPAWGFSELINRISGSVLLKPISVERGKGLIEDIIIHKRSKNPFSVKTNYPDFHEYITKIDSLESKSLKKMFEILDIPLGSGYWSYILKNREKGGPFVPKGWDIFTNYDKLFEVANKAVSEIDFTQFRKNYNDRKLRGITGLGELFDKPNIGENPINRAYVAKDLTAAEKRLVKVHEFAHLESVGTKLGKLYHSLPKSKLVYKSLGKNKNKLTGTLREVKTDTIKSLNELQARVAEAVAGQKGMLKGMPRFIREIYGTVAGATALAKVIKKRPQTYGNLSVRAGLELGIKHHLGLVKTIKKEIPKIEEEMDIELGEVVEAETKGVAGDVKKVENNITPVNNKLKESLANAKSEVDSIAKEMRSKIANKQLDLAIVPNKMQIGNVPALKVDKSIETLHEIKLNAKIITHLKKPGFEEARNLAKIFRRIAKI